MLRFLLCSMSLISLPEQCCSGLSPCFTEPVKYSEAFRWAGKQFQAWECLSACIPVCRLNVRSAVQNTKLTK